MLEMLLGFQRPLEPASALAHEVRNTQRLCAESPLFPRG